VEENILGRKTQQRAVCCEAGFYSAIDVLHDHVQRGIFEKGFCAYW
jgi:hypothetical protein